MRSPDSRVRELFDGTDADVIVCGHTHMQFDRTVDPWRVVNAGSVGMPFGERGACWLLLDGTRVELRRVEYDYVAAAAQIRATAFPGAEDFATRNVLSTPPAEAILAAFEKLDGRT